MKKDLTIALVQFDIAWKDKTRNYRKISQMLSSLEQKPDLIVLPEMFNTGFEVKDQSIAEPQKGNTFLWMKQLAERYHCLIMGSLMVEENGEYYNRFYSVDEHGNSNQYDKRHLFSLGGENNTFSAGKKRLIMNYKGWKIAPMICYDLRFPVWSRNTEEYDCLIYVANWPEVRSYAWKTLLKARAIENQSFVIGVNRTGNDGNEIPHSGDSCVIDPMGNTISVAKTEETVLLSTLSHSRIEEIRNALPFLKDSDEFEIKY